LLLGSWWPDSAKSAVGAAKVREHYIAAQITSWTYTPESEEKSRLEHSDPVYKKISYREYEVDFKKEKPANRLAGLLGPTLHAEVGDTLVVHLKNMADKPVSIHPQGIVYNKNAEGSLYDDSTMSAEKRDDAVLPGQVYTYVWDITEEVGPREADLPCLTYAYYSHENMVMDFNSGLIGALLICKKGSLNEDGSQKLFDKEYVLMFGVFDENKSWQRSASLKYTINGYADGTLPDLEACAYDNISWHLIGMSSKPEIFSIHINGQSMEQRHRRVSTVNLVGGSSATVNMTVSEEGRWLISSLVQKHLQGKAGMHGYLTVRDCGDKEVKKSQLSYKERRMVKHWEYFIAAEEITWDYAPNIQDSLDRHYKAQHLDNFSNLIGKRYKKAVFRQYTDASFTKRLESPRPKETGILGPVIRAQLNDKVKIVFKNKASRPYSIYFHGVTLSKNAEGADYPLDPRSNDTRSRGIEPGETYTYEWKIAKTDQPTAQDAQCITRFYHSAVDVERDIASGLIGPLLICKSEALTQKGVQKKADGEQQAMFAVFDENKSWYIEDNIKAYCSNPASVKRDDPKFYNSNIMHTINGYVSDSSEILGFCQDNVVQWHFFSVGTHDEIVSVRLSGHSFLYQGKYEDVLNLFPMSGESVTVEMDNAGTWLLASWGTPEMNYGMRLRFRDARCEYEEDYTFDVMDFPSTKTDKKAVSTSSEEIVREETEEDREDLDYQDYLISSFNIRSLRKATDIEEKQNLTALAWEHKETSGAEYEYHYVAFDDPYLTDPKVNINEQRNPDNIAEHYLRSKGNERRYFIAAKEVCWSYAGYKRSAMMTDKTCKDGSKYKVIFQSYTDSTFTTLEEEDEYKEHLGILGPVIRAEVDDVILVHFKNLASRPYTLHAHGLFYEKSSEGSIYDDESTSWFKEDDAVQPNNSYIYVWYANRRSGPVQPGAACRSWIYYSDLNLEKDINSGLIGPILICQKGTFSKSNSSRASTRDFFLLFMVFDEEKSWYFDKRSRSPCTEKNQETQQCHKFYAINGITYSLQGLRMYEGELVRWHLLNMGGPKDIHVVHFHGQTFTEHGKPNHQLGTYTLLPGKNQSRVNSKRHRKNARVLAVHLPMMVERKLSLFILLMLQGGRSPMGLASGIILDSQIDASHHVDYWEPKLARLNNSGTYNAWSTTMKKEELPWIQVDFQRQVLLTGIQTQGAKQFLKSLYVQKFCFVYSKDKRKWSTFKGDSSPAYKIFEGNSDAYGIKENIIDPPVIARYVRVYPTEAYNRPTLRMELLGCEVDGCSLPLGMENGEIKNTQITASSVKTSWFNTWDPSLARLNQKGKVNAWRAKLNNNQQWLQIDLLTIKKITAIVTQGVKSLTGENFVKTYVILYSDHGSEWKSYMGGSSSTAKVFLGNENSSGQVKHFFNPPILSRFIRIVPRPWYQGIALRVELYGCDFGGGLPVKRTDKSGSS
ncbi:Coagulation factor V, partial [Dryobates pubescens]